MQTDPFAWYYLIMVENKITRIDLTHLQHLLIWNLLESCGATMVTGEHEGSTLSLDGAHLCQADGQHWLLLEGGIKLSNVVKENKKSFEDRDKSCEHCGKSGLVERQVIIPEGRAKGDRVCTTCATEYRLDV